MQLVQDFPNWYKTVQDGTRQYQIFQTGTGWSSTPTSLSRSLGVFFAHGVLPHGSLIHSQTTQAWLAEPKFSQPLVDLIHVAPTPAICSS